MAGAPPTASISLRGYQRDMLETITRRFDENDRSVVAYLPTGGGKTRVAAAVMSAVAGGERGNRVLFVVNSLPLLYQARVALLELGWDGTDVGLVAGATTVSPSARVIIATVQRLARAREAVAIRDVHLCVVDEAHAGYAASYRDLLADLSPTALVLGLSATPFRPRDDESLARVFPSVVWGPSVDDLVRMDMLVPPLVFAPAPRPAAGAPTLTAAVSEWRRRAGAGVRTVAFCASVAESKTLAEMFTEAGVCAAHVDGSTAREAREALFDALHKGDLDVLTNCDVLTEGFDSPRIECVVLARRTTSRRVYLQTIGRGLRPAEGKEHCVVIDLVGATLTFGPVTSPVDDDYHWRAIGTSRADGDGGRPAVLRCACGNLRHAALTACPACGGAAGRSVPVLGAKTAEKRRPTKPDADRALASAMAALAVDAVPLGRKAAAARASAAARPLSGRPPSAPSSVPSAKAKDHADGTALESLMGSLTLSAAPRGDVAIAAVDADAAPHALPRARYARRRVLQAALARGSDSWRRLLGALVMLRTARGGADYVLCEVRAPHPRPCHHARASPSHAPYHVCS